MMVGLSIGFICSLIFVLFQVSGQFYSIQMGFGILNVLDPLHQTQMPIIGQFLGLLALLIFLVVGGHHMMLEAVCESYKHLPTFTMNSAGPLASGVAKTFAYMFTTAFKVGMPIIGIMILCDIAMGLLAKAAPQLNVMMFGWPIKTIVGVITLFILMPMLFTISADIFRECFVRIKEILIAMGHAR
jgi:flagellar biosynthetic protein FliR